jgi:hypothetical protein
MNKVVRLFKQLRGFFPSRLPQGISEFDAWAEDFFNTYNMPTSNKDSVKFTLATVVLNLGQKEAYKAKFYFLMVLRAAAAKQIAGAIFQDIKQKQKEAEAKALAEKANEVQQ